MTWKQHDRPRRILVTGGAQGLGAGMVRLFTSAGHQVAVADLDREAGRELAEATGCLFIPTDVGVFAEDKAAVRETVARFGGLDALCLNAGVPGGGSIGDNFDPDRYRASMRTNLDGAVYALNAALPALHAGGGAVLITSSLAGIAPAVDVYYSVAKHALVGLTRSFAMLLSKENVTVNAICPGFISTRLISGHLEQLAAHGIAVATPDEMAAAAATILDSPETGQVWEVQAGQPAKRVEFTPVTLSRTPHAAAQATGDDPHPSERGRRQ